MSSTRSKVIAIVSAAVVISGATIAIRASRGENTEASSSSASAAQSAKNGARPAATPSLSLEDWAHKIASTDLQNFRSLMDEAMKIGDAELRNSVIVSIVDRWMLEDADAFLKYVTSLEVKGASLHLTAVMTALQESLTKLDPERAASDEILVIVQRLINFLANSDPDKALVWAKKWLLDDTLDNALLAVARGMARTNIEKSLAVIDEMKSPIRRSQALATLGAIWAARDPQAALKWAMNIPYMSDRALTLNSVLMAIALNNPQGAASDLLAQAQLMADQYTRERDATMAAAGKTEADYANAPEVLNEAIANGSYTPPSNPDLEILAPATILTAKEMAAKDAAAALAFAEAIPGEFLRLKAISGVLEGMALTDPQAAFAYANKNYPENSELLNSLYSSWATKDWVSAANGTSMISDPTNRSLALESVITAAAARNDASEIVSYVNSLPPSQSTDGVKYAAATAISEHAPQQAWEIAKGISGQSAQYRALKSAFAYLVIANPNQAGTLLTSSNLSSDTSQKLKDMLDAVVGN